MHRIEAVIAALAFVVAIFVAGAVYLLVEKPATPETMAFRCPPLPSYKEVMVAKQNIPMGENIIDAVTTEKWPVNSIRQDFFASETFKQEGFKSYIAQRPIAAGEPITTGAIVNTKDKGKLAALVKTGYRAVTINVDQATAGSGLIMPGDVVDVILTSTPKGAEEAVSRTALCNVRILALDQRMGQAITTVANVAKDLIPRTATLEVKPHQAEVLSSIVKIGTASLSLHSVRDKNRNRCKEQIFTKPPEGVKITRGDPVDTPGQSGSATGAGVGSALGSAIPSGGR